MKFFLGEEIFPENSKKWPEITSNFLSQWLCRWQFFLRFIRLWLEVPCIGKEILTVPSFYVILKFHSSDAFSAIRLRTDFDAISHRLSFCQVEQHNLKGVIDLIQSFL